MKKLLISLLFLAPALALAQTPEFRIAIKDHRFTPAEVRVPANKKIKLIVANEDSSSEEFESHELNREKVIPGKSSAQIFIGPLKPGRYPFVGEFHEATAKGVIVAE
jgi:plastocyanin